MKKALPGALAALLITLLATLTLGERIPALRWLLLAGGMVGALVVIRPKGELEIYGVVTGLVRRYRN